MVRLSALFVVASLTVSHAWVPAAFAPRTKATALKMALDYNDPLVAQEFNNVQPMTFEEVEEELLEKGIRVSQAMNEMDVKLMLVEVRLRFSGKLGGTTEKKRPEKFSSKFEEAMWTKPAFAEFYNGLKAKDDHNAMNAVTEYLTNPDLALQRYGKDYKGLLRKCEAALNAPPPVNSPTIVFSGFPANMGEAACRMTLESLGAVADFECAVDEDFPMILKGKVTFEDIESAKKAVAQYNGMNMGMGTSLELMSV
ncbi:hypothetical protein FisN_4Hh369 [Fistulifera solaris]|uniref:RRM domain-containing protein n=1 Tax=Fistulifera solaris TaxID=1519565 RepID=A0A1Z5KQ52_FISSO|nr:hypothetical protein FisN_4Hh369 [Fistulifera solaris]|eukprot:GAX28440.1 hypothetical protein FisN_4Hh369 [Fistulifera solaris]